MKNLADDCNLFLCLDVPTLLSCIVVSLLQLFEVQVDNNEVVLRYSSALVQGATNVLWYEYHQLLKY